MHIAICDDDTLELTQISSLLNTYRQERELALTYQPYLSAVDLLSNLEKSQYDLLLLDILMPGFTGIEAAREIRGFDQEINIIFLTSSPDFALESYGVKARDYMLKPVSKDKLFSALDAIVAEERAALDGLSVKTQTGMARILFSKLAYVEVINKRLYFHLSDTSVRAVYGSLSDYEEILLARPAFVKVHRAFIVNLWQMAELTAGHFVARNGESVPISRLLYSEIRKRYMKHLFEETGMA